jgi:hypothetical protein
MPQVGGSAKECSIRGRIFAVTADADVKIKLGGFSNEVQANGNGTARLIKTAEPAMIEGLKVGINHDQGDPEFLQEVADSHEFVECTVTLSDDTVYQCSAQLTDMPGFSSKDAVAELTLAADGKVTKQ